MARDEQTTPLAFPERLSNLATTIGDRPAVSDASGSLSFDELWRSSSALAHRYRELGVSFGDIVSIALPSDRSFIVAAVAAWILGATPQPVSARTVRGELAAILELSSSALLVGMEEDLGVPTLGSIDVTEQGVTASFPFVASPSWKAPVSGGSTGRPKVILAASPAHIGSVLAVAKIVRISGDDTVLITAPLHHNGPFLFSVAGLLSGGHVVLAERFEADRTLRLIEEHRATWAYLVPTMMSRITKLPESVRRSYDLSSLVTLFHLAAPCPPWLKREWIEWLGPDVIWELYAGTEAQAATVINGHDWLTHLGSVGPAVMGEITVLGPDGEALEAGTVGEVWMRSTTGPTYRYLGAQAKTRSDGWESLGDLGYLDDDGYLYLCDRLADMIIVGGVNVYPAEVEAALEEHPGVIGAVVVGLPDDDLGKRLHALVHLSAPLSDDELREWCSPRLTPHKRPYSFERVTTPLRDDAAKVRRSQLANERSGRAS